MNELDTTAAAATATAEKTRVFVLDVPFGTTAEESMRLMEEPYERGYHIHRALEWPGCVRVIYVNSAKPKSNVSTDGTVAVRESRAMQFLRDNREMSVNQLVAAFKALGFPRGTAWITLKRAEVIKADRRVT